MIEILHHAKKHDTTISPSVLNFLVILYIVQSHAGFYLLSMESGISWSAVGGRLALWQVPFASCQAGVLGGPKILAIIVVLHHFELLKYLDRPMYLY